MQLTFDTYQKLAHRTSKKTVIQHPVVYPALGLVNEAGEFAGKVKKIFRDGKGMDNIDDLRDELGDTLWYIAECATSLGLSMEDIAARNLVKLEDRQSRDMISGDGDKR